MKKLIRKISKFFLLSFENKQCIKDIYYRYTDIYLVSRVTISSGYNLEFKIGQVNVNICKLIVDLL